MASTYSIYNFSGPAEEGLEGTALDAYISRASPVSLVCIYNTQRMQNTCLAMTQTYRQIGQTILASGLTAPARSQL